MYMYVYIYVHIYTHTHVNVRFKPSIIYNLSIIYPSDIHQIRSHPSSMTRHDHLGHGARHGLGLARQAPCGVLPGAGREIRCGFQRFLWIPSASFKGLLWFMDFYGFLWVSIGYLCISMIHDFCQGWIYCFFFARDDVVSLMGLWWAHNSPRFQKLVLFRLRIETSTSRGRLAGATSQSDTNWCEVQNTAT